MTEPRELRVDVGSLSLGCLEYGPVDAPAVVMFHGMSDSAWSLDSVAQPLAADHHVFSFDLRGHGRSDWGAYTLAHFVGDIRGAIETLDIVDPVVIGHSLGGQSASQFCGLYPDIPRAVVLIEALGPPQSPHVDEDPDGYQREFFRRVTEMVRQPARSKEMDSLDEAVARFSKAHPMLDTQRAAFLAEKGTLELADGRRKWRFDPSVRDWLAGHDHLNAEKRWRGVRCPTLVVQGASSWERFWKGRMAVVTGENGDGPMTREELQRRLNNFDVEHRECVEIEDAGHMVHYDQPDKLNAIVAGFLSRLGTQTATPAS